MVAGHPQPFAATSSGMAWYPTSLTLRCQTTSRAAPTRAISIAMRGTEAEQRSSTLSPGATLAGVAYPSTAA